MPLSAASACRRREIGFGSRSATETIGSCACWYIGFSKCFELRMRPVLGAGGIYLQLTGAIDVPGVTTQDGES